MPGRRRKGRSLPRCSDCRHFIVWFRFRGSWRMFNPQPIDPEHYAGTSAYPVQGKTAWPFQELVDELLTSGVIDVADDPRDHVYAMRWHALHACPPTRVNESTEPKESPR